MKCCICQKGPADGIALTRVNAKGVVPAVWACLRHASQTDAPPVPPDILHIIRAIGGEESLNGRRRS